MWSSVARWLQQLVAHVLAAYLLARHLLESRLLHRDTAHLLHRRALLLHSGRLASDDHRRRHQDDNDDDADDDDGDTSQQLDSPRTPLVPAYISHAMPTPRPNAAAKKRSKKKKTQHQHQQQQQQQQQQAGSSAPSLISVPQQQPHQHAGYSNEVAPPPPLLPRATATASTPARSLSSSLRRTTDDGFSFANDLMSEELPALEPPGSQRLSPSVSPLGGSGTRSSVDDLELNGYRGGGGGGGAHHQHQQHSMYQRVPHRATLASDDELRVSASLASDSGTIADLVYGGQSPCKLYASSSSVSSSSASLDTSPFVAFDLAALRSSELSASTAAAGGGVRGSSSAAINVSSSLAVAAASASPGLGYDFSAQPYARSMPAATATTTSSSAAPSTVPTATSEPIAIRAQQRSQPQPHHRPAQVASPVSSSPPTSTAYAASAPTSAYSAAPPDSTSHNARTPAAAPVPAPAAAASSYAKAARDSYVSSFSKEDMPDLTTTQSLGTISRRTISTSNNSYTMASFLPSDPTALTSTSTSTSTSTTSNAARQPEQLLLEMRDTFNASDNNAQPRFQLGISAEQTDFSALSASGCPQGYAADMPDGPIQPPPPRFTSSALFGIEEGPAPPATMTLSSSPQQQQGFSQQLPMPVFSTATHRSGLSACNAETPNNFSGLRVEWNSQFQSLLEMVPSNETQRLDRFDKLRYASPSSHHRGIDHS